MKHAEDEIQAAICKWLQDNGIEFFAVINQAAGRSAIQQMQMITIGLKSGVSDLVVLFPIQVIFLEVKDEKGKQSPAQVKFQKKVESLGFQYHLVRSVDAVSEIIRKAM